MCLFRVQLGTVVRNLLWFRAVLLFLPTFFLSFFSTLVFQRQKASTRMESGMWHGRWSGRRASVPFIRDSLLSCWELFLPTRYVSPIFGGGGGDFWMFVLPFASAEVLASNNNGYWCSVMWALLTDEGSVNSIFFRALCLPKFFPFITCIFFNIFFNFQAGFLGYEVSMKFFTSFMWTDVACRSYR